MKTIKRIAFFLFVAALLQGAALKASTVLANRQTRQISGFHGISVSSGIDLFLTQKNVEEVVVEAESQDLEKIITKVENGILKIYRKEGSGFNLNWNHRSLKVYVSLKTIDELNASSGSDVNSESLLKLDKLECDVSSGAGVKLELEVNNLNVETSSGSDISLKGKATSLEVSASSGSDIDAKELESKKCKASVSSGSDIAVNVTESLEAHASSGGDIVYSGNPKSKDIRESSGGDVSAR